MSPRVRPRQEDALPPVTPCRGCAGDGVGQHVTSRERQIIDAHQPFILVRRRTVYMRLVPVTSGVDTSGESRVDHAPLAPLVQRVHARMAGGFLPPADEVVWVEMLLDRWLDWSCQWCHGTGIPQLSVHALEIGAR